MDASDDPRSREAEPDSREKNDVLRHPLIVTIIGFVLTGLLGSYLSAHFNDQSHFRDIELTTRNIALTAISDISDLTSERRERANLVASAINRNAPSSETDSRKQAYDEAYIRWNSRVPGDLLRIRSALQRAYRPLYEGYVDALTNIDAVDSTTNRDGAPRAPPLSHNPGVFSKMDACLTDAYDTYRSEGYTQGKAQAKLKACKFKELYNQSTICFATIAELLYRSVSALNGAEVSDVSRETVRSACAARSE